MPRLIRSFVARLRSFGEAPESVIRDRDTFTNRDAPNNKCAKYSPLFPHPNMRCATNTSECTIPGAAAATPRERRCIAVGARGARDIVPKLLQMRSAYAKCGAKPRKYESPCCGGQVWNARAFQTCPYLFTRHIYPTLTGWPRATASSVGWVPSLRPSAWMTSATIATT